MEESATIHKKTVNGRSFKLGALSLIYSPTPIPTVTVRSLSKFPEKPEHFTFTSTVSSRDYFIALQILNPKWKRISPFRNVA